MEKTNKSTAINVGLTNEDVRYLLKEVQDVRKEVLSAIDKLGDKVEDKIQVVSDKQCSFEKQTEKEFAGYSGSIKTIMWVGGFLFTGLGIILSYAKFFSE